MHRSLTKPLDALSFFSRFRGELFYPSVTFEGAPGRRVPVLYADSTAMGLPMRGIEDAIQELLDAGDPERVREVYESTLERLHHQFHAGEEYTVLGVGAGCTSAMNILIRDILGYRVPDTLDVEAVRSLIPREDLPVFLTTLMEHHSSDLVIRETLHDSVLHIGFTERGLPDLDELESQLARVRSGGANPMVMTCSTGSNVTGIQPDFRRVVALCRQYGALVALDFAATGPYSHIDLTGLGADAVGLSPHKYPGGPQSCGLLWVRRELLEASAHPIPLPRISSMIEMIRVGEVFRLKQEMGVDRIRETVDYFARLALARLSEMPHVEILGDTSLERFAILSFVVRSAFDSENPPPEEMLPYLLRRDLPGGRSIFYVHHNLVARLLNDLYGIQVRPGCSCAGSYGHSLLAIDEEQSSYHRCRIDQGLLDKKPGWIRATFNEMCSLEEVETVLDAIAELDSEWLAHFGSYEQSLDTGEFRRRDHQDVEVGISDWTVFEDSSESPSSPAIESFLRKAILPVAANTHTAVSHTGTISTQWYDWAHREIARVFGAEDSYVLKFVRAGYDPLRILLYYLGAELPARYEQRYSISRIVPEDHRLRLLVLGNSLEVPDVPLLAQVEFARTPDALVDLAAMEPARSVALIGFDPQMPVEDPRPVASRLHQMGVPALAELTSSLGRFPLNMAADHLAGGLVVAENLPGGWQTHPVLLLREDLFKNTLPLDVGGGAVHWTTRDLQSYVENRSVLEDAGTPGIIQAIRTGLVLGRLGRH